MKTSFSVFFAFLFFHTFGISSNTTNTTSLKVTCIEKERESLLLLKQNLTDRSNRLSTWIGVECCEWHGVGCDNRNGHVVELDLRPRGLYNIDPLIFNGNLLEGELSPSLQNLKYLRYLDLSLNQFSGKIPEFLGSFEYLEYLNLSASGFIDGVVPRHLGNLSRLQYLDLRNIFVVDDHHTSPSFIFYSAPSVDDLGWVSSLSSLRYLDLSAINIGKHIDWFHPVNMLPSLHTLNLAHSDVNFPSTKFVNFTSIISLDLSLNGINSTLPVWLSNLTGLMHLNLNSNNFHGSIPYFIGMFSYLASIDLSYNSFETTMPDVVGNLSSLVRLDLSRNMLSGPIPASLGLLSRLEDLYLHLNQLSGNIPISIGQLSKLKDLDLHNNSLVGVLSETHFAKLKNLKYLDLSWNSLALNISSQWIAPFQLQILFARSCNIGPHFPHWLQTQTNLTRLNLFNSSIRDTMPEWFENILCHILDLDLSNNQISGKLPRFNRARSYQMGDGILKMNSNKFEGSIPTFPTNVYILDLSDNLLSGHVPQPNATMNPSLIVVDLSKNHFTESIPVQLCNVPSIQVLDLSQNKFSGRLPVCLGNLTKLQVMDLSNNSMTGVIPSSFGTLTTLQSLHLHNNRFEGHLPPSLQNLTKLVTMDIGNNFFVGSIPFWIGENLSSLKALNLQSNKFMGNIPLQLCQLKDLLVLNLAQNNIIGSIPSCFDNLSAMTDRVNFGYPGYYYEENILVFIKGIQLEYTRTIQFLITIDLSSNKLTGEIPDVLMNLVGLKNLNLSRNQLKGSVPWTIGNLSQLESLDLSMNTLSGRIPQSLSSLNFLSFLNLSFNNLSGAIPVGNQLRTLADPFVYEGNNGLCGPPVSKSCKVKNSSNHVGEDEDQDDDDDDDDDEGLWFYFGMGQGFVVGFVGLLGSLHFIRMWRVTYFEMLENVYGQIEVLVLVNLACLKRTIF